MVGALPEALRRVSPFSRAGSIIPDDFPSSLGDPVGGRLRKFLPAWKSITDDVFVLSVIKNGLRIDLEEPLPRGVIRSRSPPQSILFQEHIVSEVTSLLEKDAVERVRDHDRLCLSPVFVIPKRSGSLRMILNMKRINRHIAKSPFRMDHLASILPALGQDDFAVSLDLSDAYFHIPIDPSSRDLLGFAVGKETFRFKALLSVFVPLPESSPGWSRR